MKGNETRMRLQYGVNEADSWWHFAVGPGRERIWARLRQLQPRIVRIFLFDKHAPDPVREWKTFESYVQAVLNLGATPMITFAKFPRPADDPRAIRWFAERCGDVVWGSMERWGAEAVSNWYWCVWNEPNSTWIGGGLTFDQYRRVYEAVAEAIVRWLGPHLRGRRPNIGGPAVEGFAPFWMDWVWRFVNEIDPSLIGFVNWHRYTEWREEGDRPDSGVLGSCRSGGASRQWLRGAQHLRRMECALALSSQSARTFQPIHVRSGIRGLGVAAANARRGRCRDALDRHGRRVRLRRARWRRRADTIVPR